MLDRVESVSVVSLWMELYPELADGENVKPVVVDDLVSIVVRQVLQVLRCHAFIDKQLRQFRIFS